MATVTITFSIDNADFDNGDGTFNECLVRNITNIAAEKTTGCVRMVNLGANKGVDLLRDSNGNTIGTVEVTA